MNMPLDSAVTREIDLQMRLVVLMANVETELYFLQLPGTSPDAIARTVTRLKESLAVAGAL